MTSRRRFLAGAAATGGLLLAGCGGSDRADPAAGGRSTTRPTTRRVDPEHPNVLYVTGDDLGIQLGPYGSTAVRTPRLDAFATEALVFERAWCQVALCGPSRTSILTGLRPETTGVWANDTPWRPAVPDAVTLPRRFRDAGYRTYAAGKVHDPRNGPLDDAWDLQVQEWALTSVEPARDALEAAAEHDGPFFVALGFAQPHCPWEGATPDPGTDGLAGPAREADASWIAYCLPDSGREGGGTVTMSEHEARAAAAGYAAGVAALDRAFGEVLDAAEELGLLDGTIVVFWSGDHGISLGGGGGWGKRSNHAAATHIPLLVRMPDRRAGRVPGIVEAVDMYPTLAELCRLPAPPQALEGLSFAPLLQDDPGRPWKRAAFSSFEDERSVKDERYDLLVGADGDVRLHDMVEDPFELTDVAGDRPDEVARLRSLLDAGPSAALPV